jgi:hypothetical protein
MAKDRRTNQKPVPDDLKKLLNSKQLATFRESRYFGWKLKFVRMPLFQEPVFVVYNARYGLIGILDPDGHINMELELDVRSTEPEQEQQPLQEQPLPETSPWMEKRRGMAPIRDHLDELLNQKQVSTLQKIEKFGWQLNFVRQPLFEQPVAVIISPKGDKLATLELDGRIKLLPGSDVRKEAFAETAESAQPVPASESKHAV